MKPTITMREALADVRLLGNVLAGESFQAWRVLLIAMMGEKLTEQERVIFTALTGGREAEPLQRIEEGCFVSAASCATRKHRKHSRGFGQ
jgi:hypothetical protein